jgi:hypothetical protein
MPTHTAPAAIFLQDASSGKLFQKSFDRTAFLFSHTLHQSPYFSYPAILDLAKRLSVRTNRFYVEEGETTPGRGWTVRISNQSLLENLEGIAGSHTLVMLKRVHEEPEYKQILGACLDELSDISKINMRRSYRDPLMTILVTSPFRVTPYHIDSEANLLMQMHGSKSVYIFDGNDRQVLTTPELEKFWSGDITAAKYKAPLQNRAWEFALEPGIGVSNPVTFPHWVKNGAEVSISLSINFKRVSNNAADVYRVNQQLRWLGLRPEDPGKMHLIDNTKGAIYRTFRNMKHTFDSWRARAH